jgi:KDO2-lipid IV(A) lauroyltransferase
MTGRYELALENMVNALPELTRDQIERHIRDNFLHFGKNAVEMLRLPLLSLEQVRDTFQIQGLEYLHEALRLNKGVILMTGHLGFWEAGSYLLPALGIPCDIVAKPMKNPLADRFFAGIREKYGASILNSKKGARRIRTALKSGHAVAVLLDQHISPPGSVVTHFFDREAYTTSAITSMAMKHQIPVVPLFCLRNPDNSYRGWIEPMLLLDDGGPDVVTENTQKLTAIIEAAIRQDVSQWFWMHKRWRVKKRNNQ